MDSIGPKILIVSVEDTNSPIYLPCNKGNSFETQRLEGKKFFITAKKSYTFIKFLLSTPISLFKLKELNV